MRLIAIFLLLWPFQAFAQDRPVIEAQFQSWLDQTIWPRAQEQGVARSTFDEAFAGVALNWDLPDLVPPGTTPKPVQSQAEFGAPGRYFANSALDSATAVGRDMAQRHASALATTVQATGVPGQIILAIWSRESDFGRANIPYNAFQVLGTKGFMSTRAEYFTEELLAALLIVQRGDVPPAQMRSSWAGALGQPQFMPSNFLAYAQDGDSDGRADIWASDADTIASIGHYLAQHGWIAGRDWGFEVTLPAALPCTLEGPDQAQTIADWQAMGLTRVSGEPFPAAELNGTASIMLPAGRNGPAFLVTPNFYVLKDYNFSDVYALFVGHVGDRIAFGVGGFSGSWGPVDQITRSDIAAMQSQLIAQGHDVGGADGLVGFQTRRAIGRWQEAQGARATCFPTATIVNALTR